MQSITYANYPGDFIIYTNSLPVHIISYIYYGFCNLAILKKTSLSDQINVFSRMYQRDVSDKGTWNCPIPYLAEDPASVFAGIQGCMNSKLLAGTG